MFETLENSVLETGFSASANLLERIFTVYRDSHQHIASVTCISYITGLYIVVTHAGEMNPVQIHKHDSCSRCVQCPVLALM